MRSCLHVMCLGGRSFEGLHEEEEICSEIPHKHLGSAGSEEGDITALIWP